MNPVLSLLQDLGQKRRARAKSLILSEGDALQGFFWLSKGAVRIYQLSSDAREFEVARFGAGQWVAPAIALSATRFPYFLQATEASEYLFFPRREAWNRIVAHPELSAFFLNLLAERCRSLHQRLHAMQFQTLRERLLQFLLQECEHEGACTVHIPMSKKSLAGMLGGSPEALSRTLRQLEEEGAIAMQGRTILFLKCARPCKRGME